MLLRFLFRLLVGIIIIVHRHRTPHRTPHRTHHILIVTMPQAMVTTHAAVIILAVRTPMATITTLTPLIISTNAINNLII